MVREVAPEAVQSKLDANEADVTVVDIRSPGDYEQGHVPDAINVPLPELPRRVDEREWDAEEIVCVCAIGQSSIQAARLLGSYEGIEADAVASLQGGYRDWDGDLESATSNGGADSSTAADEGPEAPF
ncbi:rhodanese-like domain-containing protein [Salinarchaeum laminariae]|uniref:rhodanese-like domain-containing protein n=1 Tax=Salinarchaeum laminariae TaxID=869888 RepID=UPI0020C025A6|nr:rhodanese-like domain-containing protein [Salinarchaeum laminariae]